MIKYFLHLNIKIVHYTQYMTKTPFVAKNLLKIRVHSLHAVYNKNAFLWLKIRGHLLHAIYDKNTFLWLKIRARSLNEVVHYSIIVGH